MLVIWKSLDLQLPDHCMFWATCTLAYFGLLRAAEFTVPSLASFSPLIHLGVKDISVDSASDPSTMHVKIKASKTDPFRKGCFIHIGRGRSALCAIQALMAYLALRGVLLALFFCSKMASPSLVHSSPAGFGKSWPLLELKGISPVTASA